MTSSTVRDALHWKYSLHSLLHMHGGFVSFKDTATVVCAGLHSYNRQDGHKRLMLRLEMSSNLI